MRRHDRSLQACAEFIKLQSRSVNPVFVNIPFVGSDAFGTNLIRWSRRVVTQVVPFPSDVTIPLVGPATTVAIKDGNFNAAAWIYFA